MSFPQGLSGELSAALAALSPIPEQALIELEKVEEARFATRRDAAALVYLRSRLLRAAGDGASACELTHSFLQTIDSTDEPYVRWLAYFSTANVHISRDTTFAELNVEKAMKLVRQYGLGPAASTRTTNCMGCVRTDQGRIKEAFQCFSDVLRELREYSDDEVLGSVLHNQGVLYSHLGRYAEARQQYHEASTVFARLGDRVGVATMEMAIAMVSASPDVGEDSLRMLNELVAKSLELPKGLLKQIYLNRGMVRELLGDPSGGLEDFEQAFSMLNPNNASGAGLLEVAGLARMLAANDRVEDAVRWIEFGRNHLMEHARARHVVDFLVESSRVYTQSGDAGKALEALAMAYERNEALLVEERRSITNDPHVVLRTTHAAALKKKYPALGATEAIACTYFLEGLSAKEVAARMHLSVRTIESIRQRCRKKLGLDSSRSLESVIRLAVVT